MLSLDTRRTGQAWVHAPRYARRGDEGNEGMQGDNTLNPAWSDDVVDAGPVRNIRELLHSQPLVPYTAGERALSSLACHETDELLHGTYDYLVLLKLYPRDGDGVGLAVECLGVDPQAVRPEVAEHIAANMLGFFSPLHGGVITQDAADGIIMQRRPFSTAYPHIVLERDDFYDTATREPVLGAWRAYRIQNQRRETRRNRMIDMALLALEISKSLFPRLLD